MEGVADAGGAPVGFIAVTLDSEPGYVTTIEHLHVLPDMKGRGLGRRLIARMAGTATIPPRPNYDAPHAD